MKRPIYWVLETGSLAGGVRVVGEYANRLAQRGWDVQIWSANPKQSMGWFSLDSRIKWKSFWATGTTLDYQPLADLLEKIDGVKIATFWRTAPIVNDVSKPGEGYYLVQDREDSYGGFPILDEFILSTYAMPIQKVTTSRWVEKQLSDTTYIGLGIDSFWKETRKAGERKNYALACARKQALKGWNELCEACRYLNREGRKLTTFGLDERSSMVGDFTHYGAKVDKERRMVEAVSDRKIRELYSEAGVFISTSRHEGFSLMPLEAMACYCPTVVTNADGNMEYVEDGINCLIATDPEDVCQKTIEVLTNRKLAASLAKEGAKAPKRYKWEDAVTRLENVLLGL